MFKILCVSPEAVVNHIEKTVQEGGNNPKCHFYD